MNNALRLNINSDNDLVELFDNSHNFKTYKYYSALMSSKFIWFNLSIVLKVRDFLFRRGYVVFTLR
jgi:hypothetical protein